MSTKARPSCAWAVGSSQQSWMETTVTRPGTISFYWSVSSAQYSDYLKFYLDDQLQDQISGYSGWGYVDRVEWLAARRRATN